MDSTGRRMFAPIRRFIGSMVAGETEELVQETFTRLVEAQQRYQGKSNARTFVYGVARNVGRALLFGAQDWIGDSRGITAWVIGPSTDPALPVAPAPGLDIAGLGLRIAGADDAHPLFGGDDGVVQLGGIAAMFFGSFDFWNPATQQPRFVVDSLGGAVERGEQVDLVVERVEEVLPQRPLPAD